MNIVQNGQIGFTPRAHMAKYEGARCSSSTTTTTTKNMGKQKKKPCKTLVVHNVLFFFSIRRLHININESCVQCFISHRNLCPACRL